ncbi:hypothetical protein PspKH34_37540 [Parageobacillus sp. KH3-4]|nr:hypothetical protein PspKH34_37540 [Parageobacillus sp. KH3-4]
MDVANVESAHSRTDEGAARPFFLAFPSYGEGLFFLKELLLANFHFLVIIMNIY